MSRKKTKKTSQILTSPEAQADALEHFRPLLSENEYSALVEELDRPLYPAFRINPLKVGKDAPKVWAARYGWDIAPVPYCSEGWWVKSSPEPVSQTIEHRMGQYYLQDAASMLPVELFDFEPDSHPLILDLAASPGGKTTHLTARTLDQGLVIANDSAPDRITALRIVLQTWGAVNIAVTRFPAEKYGRWFPETFDRILLDAPCSMQSLRSTDSHPMRPISPREQNTLSHRQLAMLESALAALKPGGQIVYSTCTLAPEEDESVLDQLLSHYPQAVRICPLEERIGRPAPALTEAYGQVFDPQVQNAARLWPHRFGTSGFFSALIQKTNPIETPWEASPSRPLSAVGQQPVFRKERAELTTFLDHSYGISLESILDRYSLDLWSSQAAIFAIPKRFLENFKNLPCQLLGIKLIEDSSEGWIPAHEWVSRFGSLFTKGLAEIDEEQSRLWLQGNDLNETFPTGDVPTNGVVVVKDREGRIFGRGDVQSDRLRNLLPRRLF